jgi:hypothetical protein
MSQHRCNIYVLLCADNTYYIGRTKNIIQRLRAHVTDYGPVWTRLHKPLTLIKNFIGSPFDEDKWTLIYMAKYGIQNVRGGTFSSPNLTQQQIQHIRMMLDNAQDKCFRCHKFGHFVNECRA